MRLLLERMDKQTIGRLYALDNNDASVMDFPTLELPWKDNQRRVSCIPTGKYRVIRHTSPKFGKCFWVRDVPNRREILIHPANFQSDLLGCIGVGMDLSDINGDGDMDITSSRKAVAELLKLLPSELELEIKW